MNITAHSSVTAKNIEAALRYREARQRARV